MKMRLNRKRIQLEICRAGLSVRALSIKSGISRPTIYAMIERGSAQTGTIKRLADALGLEVEDILI